MTTDPDVPKIIDVAEGLWVRQEIDNLTWFDMGDHVLAVDALEHAAKADDVFEAIERTTGGKPVQYLLNTHTHYDHVALNDAFVARWGTEVIDRYTAKIPDEGLTFTGARTVRMIPMGGCHTDEDCIVWSEDDSVLLTGDIFGWGLIPLTVSLRTDSAMLLLETYGRLIDLQAATVVPGHGPLCTSEHLQRRVTYFRRLVAEAAACIAANMTDDQILAATEPPEDMTGWWRFVQWKHEDSVRKVLSAVRRERLKL